MKPPRFLLKDKNDENETSVYMVLHLNGQRMKYSTGLKILPAEWNPNTQRMYERKGLSFRNFNKILDNYVTKVKEICLDLEAAGKTPTVNLVKIALEFSKGKPSAEFLTVNEYLPHYVEQFKKRNEKTARFFDIARKKLDEFNPRLAWTDLNEPTYRRFVTWMERKHFSDNYIGSITGKQRIMFNAAYRDGFLKHTAYKIWRRKSEEVYKIYLTEDELQTIYEKELTGHLAKARDLFIIGCCTGLRVENYLNIDPKIQVNNGFIHAITNKNGPRVMIPIHWMVDEILKKYKGFPKTISEQRLNSYVKLVCEECKINTSVQWFRTEGGKRVIHTHKKWELVSTHTARRSFATNLYLRGENPTIIMAVTGHKTTKMFFKYIKITSEESSRKLAQSDFFRKKAEPADKVQS